jgi:imidazole glycerol-phosphate synthase subunit HisH
MGSNGMICIVDYGAGNLKSVFNAFDLIGCDVLVSKKKQDLLDADKLVIPGVGAFPHAMQAFQTSDLIDTVKSCTKSGKPLLGICLGMQILASFGYEGGAAEKGLDIVAGEVKRLDLGELNVPHVGWNDVEFQIEHPVLHKIHEDDKSFYFVHSYYFDPQHKKDTAGITEYGKKFCSLIVKDNVIATQFHPEKSQENGLRLLENFARWTG